MKKKLFKVLFTLLLCIPFLSLNAANADVKSISAVQKDGVLSITGETDEGVYAVQVIISEEKTEKILLFKSIEVKNDNTFALEYTVEEGNYIVKLANYDGGTSYVAYVYPSSVTDVVDIEPVDTSSSIDKRAAKEVSALVEKLVAQEEIEGISSELQTKLLNAVTNGSDISVEVNTKEVTEEEISEDAQKVLEIIDKDAKVAKYLDIAIPVTIDGNVEGYVTKLDNLIEIKVDIPESLPEVKSGYTRTYTVVKVHEGVAEELKTTVNSDGTLSFKTKEFSTYAITYLDTKNPDSPTTGDNLGIYLILFTVSGALVSLGALVINKRKALKK